MVHALQEAWRVLVPRGLLIDLRPIAFDCPLEVVTPGGCESAGLVDMSPQVNYDLTSEHALQVMLDDALLKELQVEYFDSAYYWNTLPEMKAYIDEVWQDDLIIAESVVGQAQVLLDRHPDQSHLRLRFRMKLAKFEKQ